ncbi:MAG: helix-hairpin-helix domain-containing protein [Bacteroidota bacterium]
MPFPDHEREALLTLKGVGPTVVLRLEQLGFSSLAGLRGVDPVQLTHEASAMLGATCWRNSPQARAAMRAVAGLAEDYEAPAH